MGSLQLRLGAVGLPSPAQRYYKPENQDLHKTNSICRVRTAHRAFTNNGSNHFLRKF
jgi:hypothetical protein